MEISYHSIKSLVVKAEVEGSRMVCTFRIPDTGEMLESTVSIKRDRDTSGQIQRQITRTVTNRARSSLSSFMRGVLGGGMLGQIGSQVINTATREAINEVSNGYSSKEQEQAIVDAFAKIANQLTFDGRNWTKAKVVIKEVEPKKTVTAATKSSSSKPTSEFEKQLTQYPITNSYDKEVLSRMMIEVAKADGGITSDEEAFLQTFMQNYRSLSSRSSLTPVECEEVTKNAKLSVYLLAWGIALVDLELSRLEEAKLFEFAEWLGLSEKDTDNAIRIAKSYILERNITANSSNEDAIAVGKLLGFSENDALRAFVQYKKRLG